MTRQELISSITNREACFTNWKTVDYNKVEKFFKHFFISIADKDWIETYLKQNYDEKLADDNIVTSKGHNFFLGVGDSYQISMDFEQAYNILFDIDIDQVQIINF